MLAGKRTLSVLISFGYVLTITASALFHNHGGGERGHCGCSPASCERSSAMDCGAHEAAHSRPVVSAAEVEDHGDCSVCQFLSQKPAPAADLSPPRIGSPVEEVSALAWARVSSGVFTAWRSRAPPAVA